MSAEEAGFGARLLALGRHFSIPFSFELTGAAACVIPAQPEAVVTLRSVSLAAGFRGDETQVVEIAHGHTNVSRAVVARLLPGRVETVRVDLPLSAHAENVALSLAQGDGPISVVGTIETRLDEENDENDDDGDLDAYPAEPMPKTAVVDRDAVRQQLRANRRDILADAGDVKHEKHEKAKDEKHEKHERDAKEKAKDVKGDVKSAKTAGDVSGGNFREVRGVKVCDVVEGSGPGIKQGQRASVGYVLRLGDANGRVLDETRGKRFKFRVGVGEVISGWDIGVSGMRVGGKRVIVVPPHLGYGKKGVPPDIPPNATLHFEVVLHGFQ